MIKQDNKNKWIVLTIALLLIAIAGWYFTYNNLQKASTELHQLKSSNKLVNEELQKSMLQLQTNLNRVNFERDSIGKRLSKADPYYPYIGMLQYRDSVCAQLPFRAGDIVLIKPDSVKGVIAEVLVSGSSLAQMVQYRVVTVKKETLLLDAVMLWLYKR